VKKIRLIRVAKEFNVGINTLTDHLLKKGITIDPSPNTQVTPDVYAVLEKEFGSNRSAASERDNIRERIQQNKQSVSLGTEKKQESQEEEEREVIIKSNVISVKDEIQQPKILGKIDLEPKAKEEPKKEEPKAIEDAASEGYTIQVLASAEKISLSDAQFKSYRGKVKCYMGSGALKYKFCYGEYPTRAEAQRNLATIRRTFSDAFVVHYSDGKIVK
jgi:hypothetical protein